MSALPEALAGGNAVSVCENAEPMYLIDADALNDDAGA